MALAEEKHSTLILQSPKKNMTINKILFPSGMLSPTFLDSRLAGFGSGVWLSSQKIILSSRADQQTVTATTKKLQSAISHFSSEKKNAGVWVGGGKFLFFYTFRLSVSVSLQKSNLVELSRKLNFALFIRRANTQHLPVFKCNCLLFLPRKNSFPSANQIFQVLGAERNRAG